jgi:hypothetical protein
VLAADHSTILTPPNRGATIAPKGAAAVPQPTPKDNWIAQFVTVLVVETKPSRGNKFARLIAGQEWRQHQDEPAREVALRWVKKKQKF